MALQVQFDVSEYDSLDKIQFTDTTGSYDASSNPGGYGSPNKDYGDIDNVMLYFTFPDGSNYDIDSSDIGGWTPTSSDTDVDINITTITSSGMSEFPDGIYEVKYEVYDSGNLASSITNKVLLTGQASICQKNRYSDICECESYADYCSIVKGDALIRSAIVQFNESNFDYADSLIKQALKHCKNDCINCE